MNGDINLLITLTNGKNLMKVAIKILPDTFDEDVINYPLEQENKDKIKNLLPLHCKNFGNIVAVEEIFEIKTD